MNARKGQFFKKEETIIATVLILSWALFFFGYRPRVHKLRAIQEQVHNIQEGTLAVSDFDPGSQSLSDFIFTLKERFSEIKARFPFSEEPAMKAILQLAAEDGISIMSIKSVPKKLEAGEEKIVSVLGSNVKRICLDIYGRGYYSQIGKFLKDIRKNLNIFTLLDSLRLERSSGTGKLNAYIKVSFYVANEVSQN